MFTELPEEVQGLIIACCDAPSRVSFSFVARAYVTKPQCCLAQFGRAALKEGSAGLFFLALKCGYQAESEDYHRAVKTGLLAVVHHLFSLNIKFMKTIVGACIAYDREEACNFFLSKVPQTDRNDTLTLETRPWLVQLPSPWTNLGLISWAIRACDYTLTQELLELMFQDKQIPVNERHFKKLLKRGRYDMIDLLLKYHYRNFDTKHLLKYDAATYFDAKRHNDLSQVSVLTYCAFYRSVKILNYLFAEEYHLDYVFAETATSVEIFEVFRLYNLEFDYCQLDALVATFDAKLIRYFYDFCVAQPDIDYVFINYKKLAKRGLDEELVEALLLVQDHIVPGKTDLHTELLAIDESVTLKVLFTRDPGCLASLFSHLRKEASFRWLHRQGYAFTASDFQAVVLSQSLSLKEKEVAVRYLHSVLSIEEASKVQFSTAPVVLYDVTQFLLQEGYITEQQFRQAMRAHNTR